MRAHLARADSELEAAQRLLDPRTDDEFEMAVVRAVANARTLVGDALETSSTLLLLGRRKDWFSVVENGREGEEGPARTAHWLERQLGCL